jgi:hypothetical protein
MQGIIDINNRCQLILCREKTIIERVSPTGNETTVVKTVQQYEWYSYGWAMGMLSHTAFGARIFDRYEHYPNSDWHTVSMMLPLENNRDLKECILPWVRTMTRPSKGRWSVAAKKNSWPGPTNGREIPLVFSFEKAEDAVKFKVFGDGPYVIDRTRKV